MTGIVEFLAARLNEDEQAAMAASLKGHKTWRTEYGELGDYQIVDDADRLIVEELVNMTGQAEHIALNDPASVLRDVEAKRQIIQAHPMEHSKVSDFTDCAACLDADSYLGYPCLTVRLLALPFADHPDYREEWRP